MSNDSSVSLALNRYYKANETDRFLQAVFWIEQAHSMASKSTALTLEVERLQTVLNENP